MAADFVFVIPEKIEHETDYRHRPPNVISTTLLLPGTKNVSNKETMKSIGVSLSQQWKKGWLWKDYDDDVIMSELGSISICCSLLCVYQNWIFFVKAEKRDLVHVKIICRLSFTEHEILTADEKVLNKGIILFMESM